MTKVRIKNQDLIQSVPPKVYAQPLLRTALAYSKWEVVSKQACSTRTTPTAAPRQRVRAATQGMSLGHQALVARGKCVGSLHRSETIGETVQQKTKNWGKVKQLRFISYTGPLQQDWENELFVKHIEAETESQAKWENRGLHSKQKIKTSGKKKKTLMKWRQAIHQIKSSKGMVIKVLSTLKRRTDGLQYRNRKYKKYQTAVAELKNTVTVLKKILKGSTAD